MSDTPETDALRFPKALNAFEAVEFLMGFARKLERERDEARRTAALWRDEAVHGDPVPDDDREFFPWER